MRMVRNVMMALAVLASATAAQADSFVWYSAVGNNAASTSGPAAQGTALNLACNTAAAGSCSWTVTMNLNTGSGGLVQHATDLKTAAGNGLAASAAALGAGQPFTADQTAGTGGAGAALLVGSHGSTFAAGGLPAATNFTLLTFTLTRSYNVGDLSLATIQAATSPDATFVWANTSGSYENVGFGSNAVFEASEGTTAQIPVINVQNVPEPTSLGLLAIGALAIVRRRISR